MKLMRKRTGDRLVVGLEGEKWRDEIMKWWAR